MTSLGGVEGLGFIRTRFTNNSIDYPDVELHFIGGNILADGGRQMRQLNGISDEV